MDVTDGRTEFVLGKAMEVAGAGWDGGSAYRVHRTEAEALAESFPPDARQLYP